jgi:hypothetical protein
MVITRHTGGKPVGSESHVEKIGSAVFGYRPNHHAGEDEEQLFED